MASNYKEGYRVKSESSREKGTINKMKRQPIDTGLLSIDIKSIIKNTLVQKVNNRNKQFTVRSIGFLYWLYWGDIH